MLRNIGLGVVASLLLGLPPASAQVVVSVTPGPGADFASELGIPLAELEAEIGSGLEEAFNTLRPGEYVEAFADAVAFSAKGLAVDHASNPRTFVIGLAGNITAAVGDDGFDQSQTDQPVGAPAANLGVVLGANVGWFVGSPALDNLVVYMSGFGRKQTVNDIDVNLSHFGVHAQYQLLSRELNNVIFGWGGLDVSAGLEFTKTTWRLNQDLVTELPVGEEAASVGRAVMTSTGVFELKADTFTIPFEVTTNLRILYILSLFGGVGLDIVSGSSSFDADLDGDLVGQVQGSTEEIDIGTAQVTASATNGPRAGRLRFLAGLQANLWRFRVFAQANLAPDRAVGVSAGARLVW